MDEFTLIRPDPKRHREAIADLTGKAFASKSYWHWLAYCRDGYLDGSHYDWNASTVGLINGRVVTHWGVWGYRMRIGHSIVSVAGVGGVATDGRLRKSGLMKQTALSGIEASARAGYDFTLLFGIPDFYHKYGFVRAWPQQTYVSRVDTLPKKAMRLSRFVPRHRDDLAGIYNLCYEGLTGTAVRPTYGKRKHGWQGYLWKTPAGKPAGYVIFDTGRGGFQVIDAAGDGERIIAAVGSLARRRGANEVRWPALHYLSETATILRRGDCRLDTEYFRSAKAMVRLLNLPSALKKIDRELAARLARSSMASWCGELVVADARHRASLHIDRGAVEIRGETASAHGVFGGEEIAQLLIGTDDPAETAASWKTDLSGDAAGILPALFPHTHPMLSLWDGF